MSQYNETNHRAWTNGASAIGRLLRVKLTSAKLALAGAADQELGVVSRDVAANEYGDVWLRTAYGTVPMIAAGAVTQGAKVYTAASGKVSATQATGAFLIGEALEAATADGDIIEVLRMNHGETAGA